MADIHKENSKRGATQTPGTAKSPAALAEEKTLKFWRDNKIFEKSLAKPSPAGEYVFYDGPPFATGLPHYGHILISAIKDAVPRYQTMRGKHVERRWGWDCHGLPIENIVEKDLKVSGKREIEALGVDRFNEYARSKVLGYANEWKETVERIGRWVDYDGAYMTMDNSYIESVWWALKEIWDKKLIYEGTKVLPYCPRCETPIANAEIAMDGSYKDITDISVYVKLALVDEPKTYLIVWTTTPWTLPGNTAVGVNEDLDYVIVKMKDEYYIVHKDKTSIFKEDFEIVEEIKGRDLIGKKYKPPFDYFTGKSASGKELQNKENAWQVYSAPYVTAEAGSGIVHLAPAYGEEDMVLAKKYNIPFVRHVGPDGKFIADVTDFAGLKAKPKDDHQSSDILIIKNLAARDLLFAKEKIVHSYPHCFRCETPLFYFAIPAWFIKIQDVKKDIVDRNKNINWIPEHLKFGRFGNNIAAAPDWNISRNRYWASPLPFWKCDKCDQAECLGSLADIQKKVPAKNKYIVMRHGEADHNLTDRISSSQSDNNNITEKGRTDVLAAATKLKAEKIDIIYSSDFPRAKQTTEILAKELGVKPENIFYTAELGELKTGIFDGKTWTEYRKSFPDLQSRFDTAPKGGETLLDVRNRAMKFLHETETKHVGKKILIVSHGDTVFFLEAGSRGFNKKDLLNEFASKSKLETSQWRAFDFAPIPHNKQYELDLHRPYVDDITYACKCGGTMKRILEVIDCWFESGSMPFAQSHYPFKHAQKFTNRHPADFVAEYIAQTRTWFYYMHAVSVMLFGKEPFKNVLTTGTILAEDGEKMSKSKGNFVDPQGIFDKFGVDALRFHLLSSPLLKAEDLNFSEKGVDEVYKKVILRLKNVVSFYETYRDDSVGEVESGHVLDRWILARLNVVIAEVTAAFDAYELNKALSSLDNFIEDVSVWFLRRSRERLKSENEIERKEAVATFRTVLAELSKLMAPVTPFVAEEIHQILKLKDAKESVHLEDWPMTEAKAVDQIELLADMVETRRITSLALEARAKAGIKIRQPLQSLVIKSSTLEGKKECLDLIADEVNLKEISFDPDIVDEVTLDTKITDTLKEEGNFREFVRSVQDLRKKSDLKPGEMAVLSLSTNPAGAEFLKKFEAAIKKLTHISAVEVKDGVEGEEVKIEGLTFNLALNK